MAIKQINYPISSAKQVIFNINAIQYACDINISSLLLFEKMIEYGFSPESWEKINEGCSIYVDGIPYKNL